MHSCKLFGTTGLAGGFLDTKKRHLAVPLPSNASCRACLLRATVAGCLPQASWFFYYKQARPSAEIFPDAFVHGRYNKNPRNR